MGTFQVSRETIMIIKTCAVFMPWKSLGSRFPGMRPALGSTSQGPYSRKAHFLGKVGLYPTRSCLWRCLLKQISSTLSGLLFAAFLYRIPELVLLSAFGEWTYRALVSVISTQLQISCYSSDWFIFGERAIWCKRIVPSNNQLARLEFWDFRISDLVVSSRFQSS